MQRQLAVCARNIRWTYKSVSTGHFRFFDEVAPSLEINTNLSGTRTPVFVPLLPNNPRRSQRKKDYQMLKFKRTTITINGDEELKGYTVEGLDNSIFRGLKVVLVKDWDWKPMKRQPHSH